MEESGMNRLNGFDIYIGSFENAQDEEYLQQMGIKSICAIADSFALYPEHESISYKFVKLDDTQLAYLRNVLNETLRFLETAERPLLVHSDYGNSRAAAICCWFLMNENNWTYDEAYADLKLIRKTVRPNDNFRKQLKELEPTIAYKHGGIWGMCFSLLRQGFRI